MKITILNYTKVDTTNSKKGVLDFKVEQSDGSFEIFRNVGYFVKEPRSWISFPMFKRGDKWILYYERSEPMRDIMEEALRKLELYFEEQHL